MPSFTPGNGNTLHLVVVGVNRIGKQRTFSASQSTVANCALPKSPAILFARAMRPRSSAIFDPIQCSTCPRARSGGTDTLQSASAPENGPCLAGAASRFRERVGDWEAARHGLGLVTSAACIRSGEESGAEDGVGLPDVLQIHGQKLSPDFEGAILMYGADLLPWPTIRFWGPFRTTSKLSLGLALFVHLPRNSDPADLQPLGTATFNRTIKEKWKCATLISSLHG